MVTTQQFVQIGPWLMDKDVLLVLITATVTLIAALGGAFIQHFFSLRAERIRCDEERRLREEEARQADAKEAKAKREEEERLLRESLTDVAAYETMKRFRESWGPLHEHRALVHGADQENTQLQGIVLDLLAALRDPPNLFAQRVNKLVRLLEGVRVLPGSDWEKWEMVLHTTSEAVRTAPTALVQEQGEANESTTRDDSELGARSFGDGSAEDG